MLFNSFEFIFIFLPIFLISIKFTSKNVTIFTVIIFSLIFYAYWEFNYIFLLLFSIIFNFYTAKAILSNKLIGKKLVLFINIFINLIILFAFKYSLFFTKNLQFFINVPLIEFILPLAISFYSFQQIGFIIDCYNKEVKNLSFKEYLLFVSFFPQLIAGPIVKHNELIPQISNINFSILTKNFNIGFIIFTIGLFKKVFIADNLAIFADVIFNENIFVSNYSSIELWFGLICYSFQIYFDFSGYSDMAIGLALLINIKLPLNFNSPYKKENIFLFWKNWHITLSRFINNYIFNYISYSLTKYSIINQYGKIKEFIFVIITPIMISFILSGFWHGASWNFIIWGFFHAVFIILYQLNKSVIKIKINKNVSIIFTFFCVTIAWVPFRTIDFEHMINFYVGLFNIYNIFNINNLDPELFFARNIKFKGLSIILISFFIIFFLPNIHNFLKSNFNKIQTIFFQIFIAILAIISFLNLNKNDFLYFQF